jgi:hypothetical protein
MEIEPLNVVPAGIVICNCDAEETLNAGTVVADAERAINGIIRRANNTAHVSVLIFSFSPLKNI